MGDLTSVCAVCVPRLKINRIKYKYAAKIMTYFGKLRDRALNGHLCTDFGKRAELKQDVLKTWLWESLHGAKCWHHQCLMIFFRPWWFYRCKTFPERRKVIFISVQSAG